MPAKPALTLDALTPRDKAVCDGFVAGETRKALGARFGVTKERIGQILHQPGAVAHMLAAGGTTRALLYAKLGEELLARSEWGGMKLADLLAIWKAAMPQEVTVNTPDLRREAERVAEELGLDPDNRAKLIDFAARKKAS